MPREIYYNNPDAEANAAKAMEDIKSYLGEQFEVTEKLLKDDIALGGLTRGGLLFSLEMFLGIEGYPAEVWADLLGVKDKETIS